MTLTTPYQASFYVGDGETKAFPFVFEELSDNFVKVIVSHIDGTTSIPTYTVDLDLKQVVFGDETPAPTADDVVCIYRETPTIQDTPFKTLEGYNAKALENILSKIVAMIQEIKSNYFSTQVLQGDPWQLDLLKSADDGATVNIDYTAKKLVKGLYFQITDGNLQVSADGSSYITMPKSADIVEFRQTAITLPDLSVVYKLQYRIGNEWFDAAESTAEVTAEEAKQIAEDASDAVSAHITDTNNPHSVTVAQIGALPDTTKYGATLSLTIDSTTYVVTAQLKDQDGNNLGTAQTIDLPLESVVVSGAYDSATKEVVLTLQGGSTIRFSVADLVSGLQTEITALNMLDADLVDDATSTHKFVTTTEKSTWNGKQDTISDLATIRSGASAGATAVQPGDLATVATSGSYNDLSNKPTIPTVDQTYDATSANAQSGVAINGANFLVNNAAGSANGVAIKGSGSIQSTQIGALGSAVSMSTSVGFSCFASGTQSIAVGHGSQATASKSYAFGEQAKSTAIGAFQFGQATNSEAGTVCFALTTDENTTVNYKLLDSYGLIPGARLADTTSATQGQILTLDSSLIPQWANAPSGLPDTTGATQGQVLTLDGNLDPEWADASGGTSNYHPDLFDWKWADHQLNDVQWLRADTFSWQSGAVYEAGYQHLADDIDGKTLQSETIGGTTIQFYLADDGHKIVLADQESNVAAIYIATGVAWYYILDTVNERFKLPRTQYGVTGLRDTVGNYVPESLPNITGNEDDILSQNAGGAFRKGSGNYKVTASTTASSGAWFGGITFDASRSSSAYQNDAPVQQRATQQYLYFYVGEFTQSAVENTAGLNAELFNGKANVDMDNLTAAGKSLISGLGMPSSRFIDLTLGASTSTYTAPANGWFTCACTGTTGSTYFELVSGPLGSTASFTGGWGRAIIPVFKGQVVTVYYGGNNFTKQLFRFVYAQGAQ